jgi:hypothetical protein
VELSVVVAQVQISRVAGQMRDHSSDYPHERFSGTEFCAPINIHLLAHTNNSQPSRPRLDVSF